CWWCLVTSPLLPAPQAAPEIRGCSRGSTGSVAFRGCAVRPPCVRTPRDSLRTPYTCLVQQAPPQPEDGPWRARQGRTLGGTCRARGRLRSASLQTLEVPPSKARHSAQSAPCRIRDRTRDSPGSPAGDLRG